MNRTLLAAATAAALLVTVTVTVTATAASPALTVYSGEYGAVVQSEAGPGGPGFALFQTSVGFDLRNGDNTVRLGSLPNALDASSVRLRPLGEADVRGQRFDFALACQDALLQRAIGQSITVEQAVGDSRQTHAGVLLAAGNGLTLRMPDGRVKMLANYSSFELASLPEGMVVEPTLAWDIRVAREGRQQFELGYATAGLAWRAEYQVDLSGGAKACRMALEGAAMLVNRSGADFNGVALTLVAGEPNRVAASGRAMMAKDMVMIEATSPSSPSPQASGEYHAYKLPGTSALPQGSVQRLPLIDRAQGVACERRYETRAEAGDWRPPQPIVDENFNLPSGEQPVIASLQFKNAAQAGLGMPLPAGRVRVFDVGDLLGEATLGHTPANAEVSLALGTVFDLTAERTREAFSVDRKGRQMEERISVLVRNAKTEAATVRVLEPLPRWSDWDIVSSTVPTVRNHAQSAAFDLKVPAGGEARVTYTVRYRWAPEVLVN